MHAAITAPTPANRTLTTRQREIYNFIVQHVSKNQCPPTVRAIGSKFGISSPNGVMCHLKSLERKGLITRNPHVSCGIRLSTSHQAISGVAAWRERPLEPGQYLVIPGVKANGCAEGHGMRLTQADIDRGVPFDAAAVYGPIPERPTGE